MDKFPPMLDYVVPSGVRVADGARVRLGAHLAEGTTVMHEGFVNFNAGTIVTLPGGQQAKARDLSGQSGLLFRRNSITGSVEAITRPGMKVSLSTDLHAGQ